MIPFPQTIYRSRDRHDFKTSTLFKMLKDEVWLPLGPDHPLAPDNNFTSRGLEKWGQFSFAQTSLANFDLYAAVPQATLFLPSKYCWFFRALGFILRYHCQWTEIRVMPTMGVYILHLMEHIHNIRRTVVDSAQRLAEAPDPTYFPEELEHFFSIEFWMHRTGSTSAHSGDGLHKYKMAKDDVKRLIQSAPSITHLGRSQFPTPPCQIIFLNSILQTGQHWFGIFLIGLPLAPPRCLVTMISLTKLQRLRSAG